MNQAATYFGGSVMQTVVWEHVFAMLSMPLAGLRCCRAAVKHEKQGYEFAAAMQWRKAAQYLSRIPVAPDLCWKQWERVMRLPRSLAGPIGADSGLHIEGANCSQLQRAPATISRTASERVPLATAA